MEQRNSRYNLNNLHAFKNTFKFLFNSSKNSTTSVHVIFFLNTTLHYDPNKIGTTQFGFIKLKIQFLQNSIKSRINELAFEYTVTVRQGPHVSWARASATRNRGDGLLDAKPAELADGGVSDDEDGTSVTASTSQTYQATWMDLLPAIKTTATAMAARGFGSTV